MAVKKSNKPEPKKAGRPAESTVTVKGKTVKGKGKPVVIFLPPVLHSRVRLAGIALGTNISSVVRGLLEEWVTSKKKAIAAVVNMEEVEEDNDEEEEEEEDTDTEDADDEEEEDDDEDDE